MSVWSFDLNQKMEIQDNKPSIELGIEQELEWVVGKNVQVDKAIYEAAKHEANVES